MQSAAMNTDVERNAMQRPLEQCGRLTAATAGLWLVLTGPAYALAGTAGLEGLSYAAVLCLIPGWLVFYVSGRYGVADQQVAAVAGATLLRLAFVVGGIFAIGGARPGLGIREFLAWVVVFYLATLAYETAVLLKKP